MGSKPKLGRSVSVRSGKEGAFNLSTESYDQAAGTVDGIRISASNLEKKTNLGQKGFIALKWFQT